MFAGHYSAAGQYPPPPQQDVLQNRLTPLIPPKTSGQITGDHGWLYAQANQGIGRPAEQAVPLCTVDKGVTISFWGRLDNRDQIASILNLPDGQLKTLTDSDLALALWQQTHDTITDHLAGDFAIAIIDHTQNSLRLIRDPVGVKPLYYSITENGLSFATSIPALEPCLPFTLRPSRQWIAYFLSNNYNPQDAAAYDRVKRLPPGHKLVIDRDNKPAVSRWHIWHPDAPQTAKRDPKWVDAYRRQLALALDNRMDPDHVMALEHSGGIDSGTIASYMADRLGTQADKSLRLYSNISTHNEREMLDEIQTRYGLTYRRQGRELPQTPQKDYHLTYKIMGHPPEHSMGTGFMSFFRDAVAQGARTVFSGFGGDEVVTNYGWLLYWEYWQRGHYKRLYDSLRGNPIMRAARLADFALRKQFYDDFNQRLAAGAAQHIQNLPFHDDLLQDADWRAAVLTPSRTPTKDADLNRYIIDRHLNTGQMAARLENGTLMAASVGLDYRWPLLDSRLMQQYLATPSIEKMGPRSMRRYLHRRAAAEWVPDKVIWYQDKSMGGPINPPNFAQLHDQAVENMADRLTNLPAPVTDVLDVKKLKTLMDQGKQDKGHSGAQHTSMITLRQIGWLDQWFNS